MNDILLREARDHYSAAGLMARLKAALAPLAAAGGPLTPQQLAAVDQFHTLGLKATADIAGIAQVTAAMAVLDVGSGLGGPARFLAATLGCHVTGVDLSESFVEAARYLTTCTHQDHQVRFEVGSALALPVADASFDRVLLQHVAMNIADRGLLYREIHRVLKPGGRFATFDVVLGTGDPHYPLPWARIPAASALLTAADTQTAIEAAGFRTRTWRDDTEAATAWFADLRASGPPAPPNLGTVMGPDFLTLAGNLGRNLMEGRLRVITAAFDAEPVHRLTEQP